jgi:hypothetical protein
MIWCWLLFSVASTVNCASVQLAFISKYIPIISPNESC